VKGSLPLENYWHDWELALRAPGSPDVVAKFNNLEFKPGTGLFSVGVKESGTDLPMNGKLLDATLTGKFGFEDADVAPFKVAVSSDDPLLDGVSGIESLVSGERATFRIAGIDASAYIEQMALLVNEKPLATSRPDLHLMAIIHCRRFVRHRIEIAFSKIYDARSLSVANGHRLYEPAV